MTTPLPCPWCASPPKVTTVEHASSPVIYVTCKNSKCPVKPTTSFCRTEEQAFSLWNTRAEKDQVFIERPFNDTDDD